MIPLNPSFRVTDYFFDRKAVIDDIGRRAATVLNRFGGRVKIFDKRSQRKRNGPSAPGSPPHAHKRPLLRDKTYHFYDKVNRSVVVGPAKLPGAKRDAPRALEHGDGPRVLNSKRRNLGIGDGGIFAIDVKKTKTVKAVYDKKGKKRYVRFAKLRTERMVRHAMKLEEIIYGSLYVRVKARPHTHPALNRLLPSLPSLWRGTDGSKKKG